MSKTTIMTESGATYVFVDGFAYHRGWNMGKWWVVKRIPESHIVYGVSTHEMIRDDMTPCSPKEIQVGDRFYVGTKENWRLASPAVSVVTE
jgi:hypothetical protein